MIDLGAIYLAVTGALLLVALGAGLRVLRGIVREGRDLRRRRRAGEVEKYTEDEEYGPGSADDSSHSTATCPQCGAANESGFDYCRRCAAPLRPGA
ncbi:zinc ribbon domain-containing protein [Halorubrum lipolyticum]|uniref:DUF7577 domain-containing protein n=1 Tax=Halorubrum lipolyticum DSM 21995 TaxID=1227482 RepID=M0NTV3_9EURY|nr:zinc ribbon domain-containing protein [Halorubrum lipolyticum]EMA60674.1 hypothetical protein C469_08458 [Halorubrum lipolyticum DSM 21995]